MFSWLYCVQACHEACNSSSYRIESVVPFACSSVRQSLWQLFCLVCAVMRVVCKVIPSLTVTVAAIASRLWVALLEAVSAVAAALSCVCVQSRVAEAEPPLLL
jgi:hypothetical protein